MPDTITIYTDGAARGNPGPGGYGAVLMSGRHKKELAEGFRMTTNNRMELMAVIKALLALKKTGLKIRIYTDSKYVCDAVTKGWLASWQRTGFKNKKNTDLWRELIPLLAKYKPEFYWVKGHAGNLLNERCDQLATLAADTGPHGVDLVFERSREEDSKGLL
jgi:ribonuclease HI